MNIDKQELNELFGIDISDLSYRNLGRSATLLVLKKESVFNIGFQYNRLKVFPHRNWRTALLYSTDRFWIPQKILIVKSKKVYCLDGVGTTFEEILTERK